MSLPTLNPGTTIGLNDFSNTARPFINAVVCRTGMAESCMASALSIMVTCVIGPLRVIAPSWRKIFGRCAAPLFLLRSPHMDRIATCSGHLMYKHCCRLWISGLVFLAAIPVIHLVFSQSRVHFRHPHKRMAELLEHTQSKSPVVNATSAQKTSLT